jgi:uncharacterized membrane protein YfhO
MEILFGKLPDFFQSEQELRKLWSAPDTRAKLLQGLAEKDFGHDTLVEMQKIIGAENSDSTCWCMWSTPCHRSLAKSGQITRECISTPPSVPSSSRFSISCCHITSASAWRN